MNAGKSKVMVGSSGGTMNDFPEQPLLEYASILHRSKSNALPIALLGYIET